MELKDKIAIVTGGASGIGLATVEAFLEKGAKVVFADYNEEAGKKVEEDLKKKYSDVVFKTVDVSKEEQIKSLIEETVEKFGRLDILVNNAGVGILKPTHEITTEEYKRVIEINQDSIFYGSKYAIQQMLKTGGGVIVNTSSILGSVGEAGAFPYNASKGAANLMTKSLAVEYGPKNIRVNAVQPAYVESGMVNKEALGEFYDSLVERHPIGRLGKPEEIAHAIVFLCENDFVTGTTLLVDGGYTAK